MDDADPMTTMFVAKTLRMLSARCSNVQPAVRAAAREVAEHLPGGSQCRGGWMGVLELCSKEFYVQREEELAQQHLGQYLGQ